MRKEDFFEVLGDFDDDIVKGAKTTMEQTKSSFQLKWGAMAACFCLVFAAVFSASHLTRPSDIGTQQPHSGNHMISSAQDETNKHEAQNIAIDETMTLEEAQLSEPFGGYMPSEAPAGFTAEIIRRYQDEKANYLSGLWTKGEGAFDEISWRVSSYDETMESRVTSVDDTKNYDLSLYPIPLADSVPEELSEIVDHPIFNIDELTLEAVNRRAYSVKESNDTAETRMSFGVRYGDVVVEVTTKGMPAEWVYDQLIHMDTPE